jgi:IMP cyclohydrolase
MTDFLAYLRANPYPGRGIAMGGNRAYYFIMGRSENSRNRVIETTANGVRTRAFDESRVTDPSLIMYHPVRKTARGLIVANGDQTDTIRDLGGFRRALMTRSFEPDAPHYTPRISAMLYNDGAFDLSILKRAADGGCIREFFAYDGCPEGEGYFISTYCGDGDPLPSFAGEPLRVDLPEPEAVWQALNADNRVSLYAYDNGQVKLFNKLLGD